MAVKVEERVLLLDAKPGLLRRALVDDLQAGLAFVRRRRGAIVLVGVAHDQDVVAASKRILVHGHRIQIGVRVAALRLIARAAIVVPHGQLCKVEMNKDQSI